jgi:hypothetical protein
MDQHEVVPAAARSRPAWLNFVFWFAASLVLCLIVARVAQLLEPRVGVFSIALGIVVGGAAVATLSQCQGQRRAVVLVGTLLLALFTTAAVHYFYFRDTRLRDYEHATRKAQESVAAIDTSAIPVPSLGPASFWQFLKMHGAESARVWLWMLDVALVSASACLTVTLLGRSYFRGRSDTHHTQHPAIDEGS